ALYPDPLISLILPASTVPSDLVLAARFVKAGSDPEAAQDKNWDSSVKALVRYPDTLGWLDENLEWTTQVGDAFVDQPVDVMEAIQELRAKAKSVGNLVDTPQQRIVQEDNDIRIVPAEPDYIYEPRYDPQVVYYQRPTAEPLLYFGAPLVVGSWLGYDFDWRRHRLYRGEWHEGWDYHHDHDGDRDHRGREEVFVNNRLTNVQAWHVDAKRHESQARRPAVAASRPLPSGERPHFNAARPTPLIDRIRPGDHPRPGEVRRGDAITEGDRRRDGLPGGKGDMRHDTLPGDRGESVRRGEPMNDAERRREEAERHRDGLPASKGDMRRDGLPGGDRGESIRRGEPLNDAERRREEAVRNHDGLPGGKGDMRRDGLPGDRSDTNREKNGNGRVLTPNTPAPHTEGDGRRDEGRGRSDAKGELPSSKGEGMRNKGDGIRPHSEAPNIPGSVPRNEAPNVIKGETVRPHGDAPRERTENNSPHPEVSKPKGEGRMHADLPKTEVTKPHVETPNHAEAPRARIDAPQHMDAPKPRTEAHVDSPRPHADAPKPHPDAPKPHAEAHADAPKPHTDAPKPHVEAPKAKAPEAAKPHGDGGGKDKKRDKDKDKN
ncbi:MAG: hypothetical protein JWO94_3781, partial [Verrucomicrobiaceae bacterium]|nr:hypothetical protein [Verrucomicrobiaceae bacterium]